MSHKKNVKEALAEGFKSLLLEYPFEKITIKMITDRIGVIRPTFYNHFVDKYEVLEWICYQDIFQGAEVLINSNMLSEAVKFLFSKIEQNQEFYLKAVKIQGQNAFRDIFKKQITKLILDAFEARGNNIHAHNKVFTTDAMSTYYAQGLTYIIEEWLLRGLPVSAEEMTKAYYVLCTTTVEDMLENGYDFG